MPDRYEDGIRALQGMEAPDQWDDIRQRADGGLIVPLDRDGRDGRRRWPMLLAVAALMVVAGTAALLLRADNDVTTDPAIEGPTPAIDGPGGPSTTAPRGARIGRCPQALVLTTSSAPAGWSTAMDPADAGLGPNPPAGVDRRFAGLFTGPTTGENVFVVLGLPGLQDDSFVPFEGPIPGRNAQIAPFPGGWYVEVVIPHPDGACWVTLEAIGMTQDEAIRFAQGLRAR
jgi:hypothetical protein